MDQIPREKAIQYLLKAHAVTGDTAGFNTVMNEYIKTKLPASTPINNSVLRLLLNTSKELDWNRFIDNYAQLFLRELLVKDAETYDLLFGACERFSKAAQAVKWYNDLITSKDKMLTSSLRNAFHKAVGDEVYVQHYKELSKYISAYVTQFDKHPEPYKQSKRLVKRMLEAGDESSISALMIKHFKRVGTAVQELAAAGFLEHSEAIAESAGIFLISSLSVYLPCIFPSIQSPTDRHTSPVLLNHVKSHALRIVVTHPS